MTVMIIKVKQNEYDIFKKADKDRKKTNNINRQ